MEAIKELINALTCELIDAGWWRGKFPEAWGSDAAHYALYLRDQLIHEIEVYEATGFFDGYEYGKLNAPPGRERPDADTMRDKN